MPIIEHIIPYFMQSEQYQHQNKKILKDIKIVLAYFNQYYIKTEIFPKKISRKISQAKAIREDSDYDDEDEPKAEETQNQIETARELIELIEKYLENKNKDTM